MIRKRFACLILAALMLITAVPIVSAASSEVYFTMINSNSPEPLQANTMPFLRGGNIYVPLSTLGRLGLISMRHPREVRLFVSGNTREYIHFYLENNTARTSEGDSISAMPVYRFGTFFFPVGTTDSVNSAIVCFFDINFQLINAEPAPIVRLYNQAPGTLTHAALQRNGNNLFGLTLRYNTFVGTEEPPPPPTTPPQQPQPPADNNNPPSEPPAEDDSPAVPTAPPVPVSLSFVGLTSASDSLLDALYMTQISAGFFLTAEDALTHPDLIRRLHGEGHQVGIFLEQDADREYAEASAALFDAARLRTVLVAAQTEEAAAGAADLGLIVYDAQVRHQFSVSETEGIAGNLLLDSNSAAAYALSALPAFIRGGAHRVVRFINAIF